MRGSSNIIFFFYSRLIFRRGFKGGNNNQRFFWSVFRGHLISSLQRFCPLVAASSIPEMQAMNGVVGSLPRSQSTKLNSPRLCTILVLTDLSNDFLLSLRRNSTPYMQQSPPRFLAWQTVNTSPTSFSSGLQFVKASAILVLAFVSTQGIFKSLSSLFWENWGEQQIKDTQISYLPLAELITACQRRKVCLHRLLNEERSERYQG